MTSFIDSLLFSVEKQVSKCIARFRGKIEEFLGVSRVLVTLFLRGSSIVAAILRGV